MSDKTKAVNLTEDEIDCLIAYHGKHLTIVSPIVDQSKQEAIDRINYLNKRLKSFKEPETEVKSDNSAAGWGPENG